MWQKYFCQYLTILKIYQYILANFSPLSNINILTIYYPINSRKNQEEKAKKTIKSQKVLLKYLNVLKTFNIMIK